MLKNVSILILRGIILFAFVLILTAISAYILSHFGVKILLLFGSICLGFVFCWLCWWLSDKGKLEASLIVVFILMYIGSLMAGFSYYLAYIGAVVIAESLSQVALTELVAPPVVLLMKKLVENLSINNTWPDKTPRSKEVKESEDGQRPTI